MKNERQEQMRLLNLNNRKLSELCGLHLSTVRKWSIYANTSERMNQIITETIDEFARQLFEKRNML